MKLKRGILGLPKIPLTTLSDVGEALIGFDASGVVMVSVDAGAYMPIAGAAGSPGGPVGGVQYNLGGMFASTVAFTFDGTDVTITNKLNANCLAITAGAAAPVLTSVDGAAAAVSAVGSGNLRYNDTTKTWEVSHDGGAYAGLVSSSPAGVVAVETLAIEGASPRITSLDGAASGVSSAGEGALRYNDSTKAWEASVDGGAYAGLASTSALTDIVIPDNTAGAFLIREALNEYIRVNTSNGSERLILGDGTNTWATFGVNTAIFGPTTGSVTFGFNVSDNNNAWQINRIGGGGTAWVRLSAIGVGAWIFGDNVLKPRMEFNITDNALSPWVVMDGATREYQRIVTTNGSERQDFGNATTNPDTNFLGSGIFSIAGVRMANGAQIGATVEPDFTLDTPVTIDRTLLTSGVATIVNNNEVLATLLTALAAKGIISLTP